MEVMDESHQSRREGATMSASTASESGGWELSKENIQPLSSGRKMAYLSESLPSQNGLGSSDHQYESHHLEEVRKLREIALQQLGDDPIQAWVNVSSYINQHFPKMSVNVAKAHKAIIHDVFRLFHRDEKYKNDKRLVSMYLQTLHQFTPLDQIRLIKKMVTSGSVGAKCSLMYIRAAEIFEAERDDKGALEILNLGIQQNAEPKVELEEMLTHMQDRWAANYAKSLRDGTSDDRRAFAKSVPIFGANNEPITIRQDLPPSAPTTTFRPGLRKTLIKPTPILNEEHERQNWQENSDLSVQKNYQRSNSNIPQDCVENDRENNYEATRWNTESAQLGSSVIPQPPEKLELFVESVNTKTDNGINKFHAVDKRVLKDRKEELLASQSQIDDFVKVNAPLTSENLSSVNSSAGGVGAGCNNKPRMKDFFEDIKYKKLPSGGMGNRMMITAQMWKDRNEQRLQQKELEKCETLTLRKKLKQLTEVNELLKRDSEEKLMEQQRLNNLKLQQKDEKIKQLEAENEEIMSQLTMLTTNNNIRVSEVEREKRILEEQLGRLKHQGEERYQLEQELLFYKRQYESAMENRRPYTTASMRIKQETDVDIVSATSEKELIEVDVACRSNIDHDRLSPVVEVNSYTSGMESNRTDSNSNDRTVAGNSFLPDLGNEKTINCSGLQVGKVVGLTDRRLKDIDMNLTPATAPSMEMEIPPPIVGGLGYFRKPPARGFSLYESLTESFANRDNEPYSCKLNSLATNKRTDIMKNLQTLSENMPPPVLPPTSMNSDQNPVGARVEMCENTALNDEDDEVILRKHQQTGVDLNMSDLTSALALLPKPLVNSTPEKNKKSNTENIQNTEETCGLVDFPSTGHRPSRYNSLLNDPPLLSLSTIQETSHENRSRSRSTTGSSSGNMTASTTRFGMATSSSTTHYYNVTRSSSIPRTTNQVSQLYSNGYHSDTNGK